ncbi:HAD family hydrolase [Streptosporangium pseudovulgare]|uniref:HAD family hydrolase n=1 Tax=Streptosporangium pseudovulgare TaxID=35765 RepID=A0ABQ2RE92_9ACTN|nr:HAD family hydrolase [Streptosporangium pseudovulgare]GGQ22639.1 hypothetical protein GCM10010140_61210 [Streptosporangium pseudovulgare]
MQRLALFDLDNTLIDRLGAFRRWAAEFASDRALSEHDLAWMIELDNDGALPMDQFFQAVRDRFGLSEPADVLWARYRGRLPFLVECRPEVLAGLAALRDAGWIVGIVTNGMKDNQTGKIVRSGLADVVTAWAISGAEGFKKPDPRLFGVVARRCGANLDDGGWMTGDSPEADIAGGRAVGLSTIWIDRGLNTIPSTAPDRVVTDVVTGIEFLIEDEPAPDSRLAGDV